ncbi:MAG: hypothetical protein ACP5J5_07385 [Dissulfurimicrobium sp.]
MLNTSLKAAQALAMILGFWAISAIWPCSALALQVHSGPEGLYTHQMAHVFFLAAMVFLFSILFRHPLGYGRAWVYLRLSLLFFSIWNVNAIITHSLELTIPPESLVVQEGPLPCYICMPAVFKSWVYYVGKFDHLLCVPAMFFLTMALKTFCREAERQAEEKRDKEAAEQ